MFSTDFTDLLFTDFFKKLSAPTANLDPKVDERFK